MSRAVDVSAIRQARRSYFAIPAPACGLLASKTGPSEHKFYASRFDKRTSEMRSHERTPGSAVVVAGRMNPTKRKRQSHVVRRFYSVKRRWQISHRGLS